MQLLTLLNMHQHTAVTDREVVYFSPQQAQRISHGEGEEVEGKKG